MSKSIYLFDVAHEKDTKMLERIRKDALADDTLSPLECAEILEAVDSRFTWLKNRKFGGQTGRWN